MVQKSKRSLPAETSSNIIRTPVIAESRRRLGRRPGDEAQLEPGEPAAPTPDTGQQAEDKKLQALLENARLSVLSQIKTEAEAAREMGRQRGLVEGRQAGREEIQQSLSSEISRIQMISRKLAAALEADIAGLEGMALALAYEAVCKLLGEQAPMQDMVQMQVRNALSRMAASERIQVRVHPADLTTLQQAGALKSGFPGSKELVWVADPSLDAGGCMVETDGGTLDARLDTQLELFKKLLLETRAKNTTKE